MKKVILGHIVFVAALLMASNSQAQSLKSLLSKDNIEKVVSTVTGTSTTTSIEGTWTYSGAAIEFESDNLLTKAGGTVASSTIESKLNDLLAKVGVEEGSTSYTFNSDGSFTNTVKSKTLSGTYTYDSSTEKVSLKYAKLVTVSANVSCTSSTLDLLFDADKLLDVLKLFSSSSNSTLQSISSLASSYDGLMIGFSLKK